MRHKLYINKLTFYFFKNLVLETFVINELCN